MLNSIEVLISLSLIDSYFTHEEFVLVLKRFSEVKEEFKNLKA